jgi:hypothetical protein
LAAREIKPCIPARKNRKVPIQYDAELYKQRNRVERMAAPTPRAITSISSSINRRQSLPRPCRNPGHKAGFGNGASERQHR